jgi:acetolactate synthase regulatory subunit
MSAGSPAEAGPRTAWVISLELAPDPAALERVAGLLRRRGCAIDRLSYSSCDARQSGNRIEALVRAVDVDLLLRQLRRLVDVVDAGYRPAALRRKRNTPAGQHVPASRVSRPSVPSAARPGT